MAVALSLDSADIEAAEHLPTPSPSGTEKAMTIVAAVSGYSVSLVLG